MSDCWPHFYCDTCSNAFYRAEDKDLAWNERNETVVKTLAETLPFCPCGGRFRPGANPKCPSCRADFSHQHDPVQRLTDPCVIVMDGACLFGVDEPYQVAIDSD